MPLDEKDRRQIRETFYKLERKYGAEAVIDEFEFVKRNDDAFAEASDFGGLGL